MGPTRSTRRLRKCACTDCGDGKPCTRTARDGFGADGLCPTCARFDREGQPFNCVCKNAEVENSCRISANLQPRRKGLSAKLNEDANKYKEYHAVLRFKVVYQRMPTMKCYRRLAARKSRMSRFDQRSICSGRLSAMNNQGYTNSPNE